MRVSTVFIMTATILMNIFLTVQVAYADKKSKKSHMTLSEHLPESSSDLTHEVSLSSTSGEFTSASGTNGLYISGNYKRFIKPDMEVGGRVDVVMSSYAGSNNTYIGIWGLFTYNFSSADIANSYYATGALGLVDEVMAGRAMAGSSDKKISYAVFGGRRFPWMDKLYYTPEVGLRKVGSTDMAIVIIPLNVSLLW